MCAWWWLRIVFVPCRTDAFLALVLNESLAAGARATTLVCHALCAPGPAHCEILKGHFVKTPSPPKHSRHTTPTPALKQQQTDFTSEGAPPPGKVGTDVPVTPLSAPHAPKHNAAKLPPLAGV
jgi:hypothetical protein